MTELKIISLSIDLAGFAHQSYFYTVRLATKTLLGLLSPPVWSLFKTTAQSIAGDIIQVRHLNLALGISKSTYHPAMGIFLMTTFSEAS